MRAYDIIKKKRDGDALTEGEIRAFVDGMMCGEIHDYQVTRHLSSSEGISSTSADSTSIRMRSKSASSW